MSTRNPNESDSTGTRRSGYPQGGVYVTLHEAPQAMYLSKDFRDNLNGEQAVVLSVGPSGRKGIIRPIAKNNGDTYARDVGSGKICGGTAILNAAKERARIGGYELPARYEPEFDREVGAFVINLDDPIFTGEDYE